MKQKLFHFNAMVLSLCFIISSLFLNSGGQAFAQEPLAALQAGFSAANLDDINIITIETNVPFELKGEGSEGFTVKAGAKVIPVKKVVSLENSTSKSIKNAYIETTENIPLDTEIIIEKPGFKSSAVELGKVFSSTGFESLYYYDGTDLGNTYTKAKTSFRLWAPTASEASLVIYEKANDKAAKEIPMKKDLKGTWTAELLGDHNGLIYTYKVNVHNSWNEAVDPYVRSVTVNGDKGVVLDLNSTNPKNWKPNSKPELKNIQDSIIYELNVRDLSIQAESGIKNKGKFLGLTEKGTKGPKNTKTGLDHIIDLGVTHVQLMPIFDFKSLDENSQSPGYNWGYDPKNYNSPDGTYATDAANPAARVNELKQAVQTLHDNNLRVIMDVVYNHMYNANLSNFNQLVPGYFFRYNANGTLSNGSGVGNDTASEHKMMRKFMVDSVSYWAKEYNLDGFRFDLMGIHDIETMNSIRKTLDKIDPTIIILGEGWDLGTALPKSMKAYQMNASKMPGIAHFNDTLRDAVKGSVFNKTYGGFVNGVSSMATKVESGILGGIFTWGNIEPNQCINYVEAHDNNTLWDKLKLTNPKDSDDTLKKMHRLSDAIVLTSQGIPFIQAGQEFLRTKGGDDNSYKSGDNVNQLDWSRKAANMDTVNYFKGLIKLRNSHPAFRMTSSTMIKNNIQFLDTPKNVIAYSIKANANEDTWSNIVVVFNADRNVQTVKLPEKSTWRVVVNGEKSGVKTLSTVRGDTLTIPALSTVVIHNTLEDSLPINFILLGIGGIVLVVILFILWRKNILFKKN